VSLVLAFDCAVSGFGVAIVGDGRQLAGLSEGGRDQAARLLPAVAMVLGQAGVKRQDLTLIAVTVGPGSFTGVRVGLAAARGLAVGLGIPLAGISTTSVLLAQAREGDREIVAVIDSRIADWFCAVKGDETPFVATAEVLAARLGGHRCLIIGAGARMLSARLVAYGLNAVAEEAVPDPLILARLATETGEAVWRTRNAHQGLPRPLYLRGVNITLPDGARRTVE
jgi:tRNA threonylcarbamoyladenosine biosynthesis protein TsaB